MSDFKLNFQDTKTAFADKSDDELKERHRIFKMFNSDFLVDIGTKATAFALKIGLPVKGLIKDTIFKQFCGGETIEECQPTIEKLGASNIGTILDYSVEGQSSDDVFESTKNEIHRTITRAKEDELVPFAVFKITGVAPVEILERVSNNAELLKRDIDEWEKAKARVIELCTYAHSLEQPVFIDAEESWLQKAIDDLATGMMEQLNAEKPIIFNTIQLYRNDRLEFLKESHEKAKQGNYILAVKLVRGAYMEKERARAEEMKYPSPIHKTKEATDADFDAAVDYCLDNIDEIAFVAGTHNEISVQLLAQKMEEREIKHDHPHVFFSQLYGMSDNLSYILADNHYNVSKYVPYGPVKDAVPYLIRRAKENSSVMGQMSRELDLINKELKRRKTEK
ncbi:MAG TPA: proline dehydrogenase family protein [Pyrinomonadaceae bacterium]|jgi:proline dehydrogenase